MENGFFEYKVKYWDEFDTDENNKFGKMNIAYGVVYAASFKEATEKIEQYYDKIENITIYGLAPYSVYEFNDIDNNLKVSSCETKGID